MAEESDPNELPLATPVTGDHRFTLHLKAMKAIDRRSATLMRAIAEKEAERSPRTFRTDIPMTTITDKDIIGEIRVGQQDITGEAISAFFHHDGKQYGITGADYELLRQVADEFLKNKRIRDAVSRDYVQDRIFDWCGDTFKSKTFSAPLSSYVLESIENVVAPLELWYPIAEMAIESPFSVGPYRITNITQKHFDELREFHLAKDKNDEERALTEEIIEDKRKRFQGRAAVVVRVVAERSYGHEVGYEIAEMVLDALRFYSPAALTPWKFCPCTVIGSEYIRKSNSINVRNGKLREINGGLRDNAFATWWIPEQFVMEHHFFPLAQLLLDSSNDSEYRTTLLQSIRMFSKGVASPDLSDRLMYTFSALEAIFVKDDEPIQQNLGERIAFLNAKDGAKRREIVRIIKETYKLRSQYVHRAVTLQQAHLLEEVMVEAWSALYTAMTKLPSVTSVRQFIDGIDDIKFGGSA